MSRRNDRDSDAKRHRSKSDIEPRLSPKRPRRDGKPAHERVLNSNDLDVRDRGDGDRKPRQRLQDAAPLEASSAPGSRFENQDVSKESERKHSERHNDFNKKRSGNHEGTRDLVDPAETPRSKIYFQHDERGDSRHNARRAAERGWWNDGRDQHSARAADNEQSRHFSEGVWRHDKYRENEEEDPVPPMRRRPAFREKKIPIDPEITHKEGAEVTKGYHVPQIERVDDKNWNARNLDRIERPSFRDRYWNRGDRHVSGRGGSRGFRGGERFSRGREGFRGGGGMRNEKKWEHDLFNEANKTPPRKNEEEQIAKVEALLSS